MYACFLTIGMSIYLHLTSVSFLFFLSFSLRQFILDVPALIRRLLTLVTMPSPPNLAGAASQSLLVIGQLETRDLYVFSVYYITHLKTYQKKKTNTSRKIIYTQAHTFTYSFFFFAHYSRSINSYFTLVVCCCFDSSYTSHDTNTQHNSHANLMVGVIGLLR